MQRSIGGCLFFLLFLTVCGCASLTGDSALQKQDQAGKRGINAPVSGASDGAFQSPSALIPQRAQICRIDDTDCVSTEVSLSQSGGEPGKPAPTVQVLETSYDFGVMREDRDFTHKFQIRNVGAVELVIKKIIPG